MGRLCKGTWLNTYLEYTKGQESPEAFHQWVGLCMLSAAIGRNLKIDRGHYKMYPNIFVILVAGSGMCRKSTAIHMGVRILKSIKNKPLLFSQKITAEALIQALQQSPRDGDMIGLVYADELSVFMGGDSVKSGLIPLLTNLYDGHDEWSYHTRGRGLEILTNVNITMIAASTLEWLKNSIPMDAIGGGFTGRILFVHEDSPASPNLFPNRGEHHDSMVEALVNDLEEISQYKGSIMFTPQALEASQKWYAEHFYEPRDPAVSGYFARKHDHMFKLAALLSVSEGPSRLVTDKHITEALCLLGKLEGKLDEVASSVSTSTASTPTEKVLDIMRRYKKLNHSELLKRCWRFASAQDLQAIIQTLLESRQVREGVDGKNRWYEVI
jgi:hypothetical protein